MMKITWEEHPMVKHFNGFFLSFMLVSGFSHAAEWQCFKYIDFNVPVREPYVVPGIEIFRDIVDDKELIVRQEIIPQNERVDDALRLFKEGDPICLKGRRGHTSVYKFFAYDVK
jgi:hypothetical protein